MVFDFLRKRSEEGFAQVQNIASKTIQGKLGEALSETASYVTLRRKIDSENLRRLTDGLSRSRDRLLTGITGAFDDENDGIDTKLDKLEEVLLQADLGSVTTSAILGDLRRYARSEGLAVDDILPVLRARLIEALTPAEGVGGINFAPSGEPTVIFVIGANGMGKTTTIGKIASRLRNEGNLTVLLGACDTFRAAAVEQLGEWAIRANVSIEVPLPDERGGDPVPVVARSVRRAIDEKFDVCIIDTSGRLSNNFELTEQLQNMKAAIVKELPSGPHETLLVVDGSVGRNAVDQATAWYELLDSFYPTDLNKLSSIPINAKFHENFIFISQLLVKACKAYSVLSFPNFLCLVCFHIVIFSTCHILYFLCPASKFSSTLSTLSLHVFESVRMYMYPFISSDPSIHQFITP